MSTTQNLEMDVIKMLSAAGTTLGRIFQQAEEAFLDIPRTEYSIEYKENIKKVDFLIVLTEKLISDFESFLQANSEPIDKLTQIEEFGNVLQNPLDETKLYSSLFNKDLVKVGKYQSKMGVAFNVYIKKESETYIKKLRKMLEVDLKKFKEEEVNLENLRLDHDYLKNRMNNAYTVLGKAALEKEYEKVRVEFEKYYEKTIQYFKTVDNYFTFHRALLKEFVEIQRNYYRDCDKSLTILLRKLYNDVYRITYETQIDGNAEEIISSSDVDEKIRRQKVLELSKLIRRNERKKEDQIERFISVMKNGVMLIHFQHDDTLESIKESGKSPTTSFNRSRNFTDDEQFIEEININNEMVSQENGLFDGESENKSFSINKETRNLITNENRKISIDLNGDNIVNLSSEINPPESNDLQCDETELIAPSIVLTEKSEMENFNNDILPFTDFQSNIEFPEKDSKTGIQDISYSLNVESRQLTNLQTNENTKPSIMDEQFDIREECSNSSPDIDVMTNVKLDKEEQINEDQELEEKVDENLDYSIKLNDTVIIGENVLNFQDPDIQVNINSEPEVQPHISISDISAGLIVEPEVSFSMNSLNIDQELEKKGDENLDHSIKLNDPIIIVEDVLNIQEPDIQVNIKLEPEVNHDVNISDISAGFTVEPEVPLSINSLNMDLELELKVDVIPERSIKLNEDVCNESEIDPKIFTPDSSSGSESEVDYNRSETIKLDRDPVNEVAENEISQPSISKNLHESLFKDTKIEEQTTITVSIESKEEMLNDNIVSDVEKDQKNQDQNAVDSEKIESFDAISDKEINKEADSGNEK